MAINDFRKISLSEFREQAARQVAWVQRMGGHVWITKHGKLVACVIPWSHVKPLETLLGLDRATFEHLHARDHNRWIAAKGVLGE